MTLPTPPLPPHQDDASRAEEEESTQAVTEKGELGEFRISRTTVAFVVTCATIVVAILWWLAALLRG